MAQITNGATEVKRKKDLYEHVSFDTLYGYNASIQNLRSMSKVLFSQYIIKICEHWKRLIDDKGIEFIFNTNQNVFDVELTNLRDGAETEGETAPVIMESSLIEVINRYSVQFEDATAVVATLHKYIDLGLFPVIHSPQTQDEIFDSFEKWENTCPSSNNCIGTIIDAVEQNSRVYVTVMWDPMFTEDYDSSLISAKGGYLSLLSMFRTPEEWIDKDETTCTNVGVPVYEFTPARLSLAQIIGVTGLAEAINDAVTTGQLELDFVKYLLKTGGELIQAAVSQTSPSPVIPADVPFEDASKTDAIGHRFHLYDDVVDPEILTAPDFDISIL